MATRRLPVPPPARTPNPFGLYATVQSVEDPDAHWRQGTQWTADPCDEALVTDGPCPDSPVTKTPNADGLPTWCSDPVTVYAWLNCGPIGVWGDNGGEYTRRVTDLLLRGEGRAIERAFWTGAGGRMNPHLAANAADEDDEQACTLQIAATVLVTGTASIGAAVGELEDAVDECCGGPGVLHVPYKTLAPGIGFGLFTKVGGKMFTEAGTPVVASGAYPGTSPAGASAGGLGKAWLYATGPVVARRGGVKITRPGESLDRATNSEAMVAERTYTVGFDHCLFAALATWT